MKKTILTAAAIACSAHIAPAHAVSGGKLGTLDRGPYSCEMPGDAATSRGIPKPQENFAITNASTYQTESGDGSYLRTGEYVTMTSGPKRGSRFILKTENYLRLLNSDGSETGMRCVRNGAGRD